MEVVKKQKALNKVVASLLAGKVIICPTDTVYGFLADASNKKAVEKIFNLKKRPRSKPLPIFVKDFKMAKELAQISKEPASARQLAGFGEAKQEKILERCWPGRITIILKRKKGVKIYGVAKDTIALRIPKHKFLNSLLKEINRPLAQTSVNISGHPPLNKIKEILEQFGDKVDLIIDEGNLPKKKPSKIVDLTEGRGKVLRY